MADKYRITVKHRLRRLPLLVKVAFLLGVSFTFFISFCFVTEDRLIMFLSGDAIILVLLACLSYYLLGHRVLALTLKTWALGLIPYALIAIPVLLSGLSVSPFASLESLCCRCLYVGSYPFRVLGVFLGGLIFVEILQPSQFLRLGTIGLVLAFLARIIEITIEDIFQTVDVLRMQGDWPESRGGHSAVHRLSFAVRSSPMLVSVVFRNMIRWFLPWGLISLKRISKDLKEMRNEPDD